MEEGSATRPHTITFDNDRSYVVKFKGNSVGSHVLIKELVVSRVAAVLEFSHKPGEIVEVDEAFLDGQPALQGLDAGLQFGSPHLGNPFPFDASHLSQLQNKEELAQVMVLDTLFCNRDRHANNILIVYEDDQQKNNCKFYIVDHSHVLGHDQWGESVLRELINRDELFVRDIGFNYVPRKMEAFEPFLEKLESLSEGSVEQIVDSVPSEWGMATEQAVALKELINVRKHEVRKTIEAQVS